MREARATPLPPNANVVGTSVNAAADTSPIQPVHVSPAFILCPKLCTGCVRHLKITEDELVDGGLEE